MVRGNKTDLIRYKKVDKLNAENLLLLKEYPKKHGLRQKGCIYYGIRVELVRTFKRYKNSQQSYG